MLGFLWWWGGFDKKKKTTRRKKKLWVQGLFFEKMLFTFSVVISFVKVGVSNQ